MLVTFPDEWEWNCTILLHTSRKSPLNKELLRKSDVKDAAFNGYTGFLQYYGDVMRMNFSAYNKFEESPLHQAILRGRLKAVEYIASKVKLFDSPFSVTFNKALWHACVYDKLEIVLYLLNGTKVDGDFVLKYIQSDRHRYYVLQYLVKNKILSADELETSMNKLPVRMDLEEKMYLNRWVRH